ncbi:DNA polymerase III subunit beta [Silvibacterium acidisoli]|uniref:DNA polymerase III subunit beta n=1 Tax=Acidobacteriaceae bacterium ZG23-2 TaxID=2883246 RepID=UPI00406BF726
MATAEVLPVTETAVSAQSATQLEIVVGRAELMSELSVLVRVVERNTTIPILANLLLDASEPGEDPILQATNLDQSITTSLKAQVRHCGKCAIPARKLHDYVKLLNGPEVTIRQEDNGWVSIRCGRAKTKMVALAASNFPQLPEMPQDDLVRLGGSMVQDFIKKVSPSISNVESRYVLNGALVKIDGTSLEMVATDGHRLTIVRNVGAQLPHHPFQLLVHVDALAELQYLAQHSTAEVVLVAETPETIFFRTGHRTLSTRKLAGQFPNYSAVIPKGEGASVHIDVTTVLESVKRCLVFTDKEATALALHIEEETLRISSAAKDLGQTEEQIDILGGPAEKVSVGFNGEYIRDFLELVDGSVEFRFGDGRSAALFTYRTDAGVEMLHVVMPMRLGGK